MLNRLFLTHTHDLLRVFRVKETLLRKVLQTPNMAIFSSFLSWADMDFFSTMIEGIQAATFLIQVRDFSIKVILLDFSTLVEIIFRCLLWCQDSIVHRSGL
ncbi:hypothetical protein Lalb_Chr13g0300921 [Lupinus albus]|uniref:Uncharacterized protein n=1 Tax=Lupinus albus TaxID=3870 RepID=A0A6A4PJK4_LUPAL|nr:hypothetical protein Lalb_Chr13g0300921 [Lupinus albus]